MAKHSARYVYDSGEIYRLTERQYRQYICHNIDKSCTEGPHMFGTLVGVASFNATRATKAEFEDEGQRLLDQDRAAAAKSSSEDA